MEIAKVWEIRLLDEKGDVTWGSTVPSEAQLQWSCGFDEDVSREDIEFRFWVERYILWGELFSEARVMFLVFSISFQDSFFSDVIFFPSYEQV